MPNNIEDEVKRLLANFDNNEHQDANKPQETIQQDRNNEAALKPGVTLHVHHFPDAIVFTMEADEPQDTASIVNATTQPVADTVPLRQHQQTEHKALAGITLSFFLLIIFSTLFLQLSFIIHPIIATVTLVPTQKRIQTTSSLPIVTGSAGSNELEGRQLHPVTLTQTATTPATGTKHQDAQSAARYITFYNGEFQAITAPAGTTLTGNDGVQIITDQDAVIPAANPPTFGEVTVLAHATHPGAGGNIGAYDISQACCAASVLAKNTAAFTGGQDEANFTVVTQKDIDTLSKALSTSIARSIKTAIFSQQRPNEEIIQLPCSPNVSPDHQAGDKTANIHIQVTETCTGLAYNLNSFKTKVTELLTSEASKRLGNGCRLVTPVHISAQKTEINAGHATLRFTAQAQFTFHITPQQIQHMKHLIAGKPKMEAIQLLTSQPGISSVSIAGIADLQNIPKDPRYIHISI